MTSLDKHQAPPATSCNVIMRQRKHDGVEGNKTVDMDEPLCFSANREPPSTGPGTLSLDPLCPKLKF